MEDNYYRIPQIQFENDFTIIYKGPKDDEKNGESKEEIIEIKTSKDELLKHLRYLKSKSNEIKYLDEYFIHDEFHISIFKEFIESIQTNKIELTEQNYAEYYKISSKYEYYELKKVVENFINNRPDIQKIIDQISSNDIVNDCLDEEKEKLIAKNLDFCLKYGNLSNLPISVLLRILNSPEKILNDYHLLFKFIMTKISEAETQNFDELDNNFLENIEILVTSLDYNEMTNDEIFELLEKKKFLDHFGPRHSADKIRSMLIENHENEERFKKIENESEKVKLRFESIEKKFEEQSKIILQYQKELSKFATLQNIEEIINNQKEFETKLDEIEPKNEMKFNEIDNKINEFELKLKKIELKNKFIVIKENEIEEKTKEYECIMKKVEEKTKDYECIMKKIEEKNREIENTKKEIEYEIKLKKIDEIKNEISEINKEIENREKEIDEKRKEAELKIEEIDEEIQQKTNELNSSQQANNDINSSNEIEISDGIIKYLTKKCGGNVDEKGIVKVTCSSIHLISVWPPQKAVEIEIIDTYYASTDLPNSWLKYDFIGMKVHPTHYFIRSRHDMGKNGCHLSTWVIEGSNTDRENDWKILDSRNSITCLNDRSASHKFEIQQPLQPNEYYRYLRIRQTGKNTFNGNEFCNNLLISALEYYGSIINA